MLFPLELTLDDMSMSKQQLYIIIIHVLSILKTDPDKLRWWKRRQIKEQIKNTAEIVLYCSK